MDVPLIEIENFQNLSTSTEFDIMHEETLYVNESISKSSIIHLNFTDRKIKIRFDLAIHNQIQEDKFLYVPETDILFYSGEKGWCAFNLTKLITIRKELAFYFPLIEKRDDVFIIYCDESVESTDLYAVRIDQVPVDPPYESIEFEDRIEFNSSIFGKQILKIKKGKS